VLADLPFATWGAPSELQILYFCRVQKWPKNKNQLVPDRPNSRTLGGLEIATEALFCRDSTAGCVRARFFVGGASALASSAARLCRAAVCF